MFYITFILISGVFSGFVSIAFREYDIRNKTITLGRQFLLQILLLLVYSYFLYQFFSGYTLQIGNGVTLNWFIVFTLFSTLSFYMTQTVYELLFGGTLFPTDVEVEEFIEEHMDR